MTRSELIDVLTQRKLHLSASDVDMATRHLLEMLACAMARGQRIEIRGFGAFTVRHRPARMARNPKTGATIVLRARCALHFKPGAEMRKRIAADGPLEHFGDGVT